MKKVVCFIACLIFLAACKAPRQVVIEKQVIVEVHDTIQVVQELWRDTGSVTLLPLGDFDSIFMQMEKSWAIIKMQQDTTPKGEKRRRYDVQVGNLPDTVWIPVVVTDTIRIPFDCPPTLPAVPSDGRFPWAMVLAALTAVLLWYSVGRKKQS